MRLMIEIDHKSISNLGKSWTCDGESIKALVSMEDTQVMVLVLYVSVTECNFSSLVEVGV